MSDVLRVAVRHSTYQFDVLDPVAVNNSAPLVEDESSSQSAGNEHRRRDDSENNSFEFLRKIEVAPTALHSRADRVVVEAVARAHCGVGACISIGMSNGKPRIEVGEPRHAL